MKLIKKTKAGYSKIRAVKLNSPPVARAVAGTIIVLLLSLFGINVKLIGFLAIATVFNALLANAQLKRGLPTDLELSTFSTVMVTIGFGLKWGILIAVMSKFIAMIYTGSILADHFFMISTYINAAVLAFLFRSFDPFVLGMTIAIVNAAIMFLISKNILGLDVTRNLSYTGTNLIFNFLVFSIFSRTIHTILI